MTCYDVTVNDARMIANLLKVSQEMPSPLTNAVRRYMERAEVDVTTLAAELGLPRPTLSARLTRQNPLRMDNVRDLELVRRIAKHLGVQYTEIIDTAHQFAQQVGPMGSPDCDMVVVLLDTLENAEARPESKLKARRAILRMLGCDVEKNVTENDA